MPLKTHPDEQPVLNLTAMLDVMFLLIIFFVLNTKFLDDERQINLQVPQVTNQGKLAAAAQQKTINVYRDGTITLDGANVTLPELPARLAAARGQSKISGRAGARRRPRRTAAGGRRAQRLQAGRHQRPGGLRATDDHAEIDRPEHARCPWGKASKIGGRMQHGTLSIDHLWTILCRPRPIHAGAVGSGRSPFRSRWSCSSGPAGDTAARWRNACCSRFWPTPC